MDNQKGNESIQKVLDELKVIYKDELTRLDNGTILIRNLPEKGKLAYMHKIYSPFSLEFLKQYEEKVHWPTWYGDFLKGANGLGIFRSTLSVHGIYLGSGVGLNTNFQPVPIELYEIRERVNIPNHYFIFGSADGATKKLMYNKKTDEIEIYHEREARIVKSFPNLGALVQFVLINAKEEFDITHETVMVFHD